MKFALNSLVPFVLFGALIRAAAVFLSAFVGYRCGAAGADPSGRL